MADREKVIKGLECCRIDENRHVHCADCPYYTDDDKGQMWCSNEINNDAISLLKEQDTVDHALEVLRQAGWTETQDVPFPAELLKEQEAEARLLTAEEVQNMEAGTAFGIETYYDHDGKRMPGCAWALRTESLILSYFGTMFPDTVTKIPYNTLEKNQNTGKQEKHQYRFWSKRPTFEQCKAVKWE